MKNHRPVSFLIIQLLGIAEIVEQLADEQAETHIHLHSSQRGTPFCVFRVHRGTFIFIRLSVELPFVSFVCIAVTNIDRDSTKERCGGNSRCKLKRHTDGLWAKRRS